MKREANVPCDLTAGDNGDLDGGGMAVLRNGEVARRSTITFHSGSLRDGIHYMAEGETDREHKKKDAEIGRQTRGKREKSVIHPAVNVIISEGNLHALV